MNKRYYDLLNLRQQIREDLNEILSSKIVNLSQFSKKKLDYEVCKYLILLEGQQKPTKAS